MLSCQLEAHLLLQPQGTHTLGDPVRGLLLIPEGTPHSPIPAAGGQVCTVPAVRDLLSPTLSSICSTNTRLGLGAAFWKQGELGREPFPPPPASTVLADQGQGLFWGPGGWSSWLCRGPH